MPPDPPIVMYESSPRSREVANALFQLDKLSENQVRAVLRHITIDDAVMNEAQCSHVASLISGTLHKVPREGVNAALTCATTLDAACQWERCFASHPGVSLDIFPLFKVEEVLTSLVSQHVCATFRKGSVTRENETDQSKQVVLFKREETAPAPIKNDSTDTKPSLGVNPDLKGLTIVNQGQMTLHYHSYNHASSPAPQTDVVPRKRALDKAEDEDYSEALASLMEFDLSPESRRNLPPASKRHRLEEPDIEMLEPEVPKPQNPVEAEEDKAVQKNKKKNKPSCKKCGKTYTKNQNKGSNTPCNSHPGMSNTVGHFDIQLSEIKLHCGIKHDADSSHYFKGNSSTTPMD